MENQTFKIPEFIKPAIAYNFETPEYFQIYEELSKIHEEINQCRAKKLNQQ
jgi:hypothetical protein